MKEAKEGAPLSLVCLERTVRAKPARERRTAFCYAGASLTDIPPFGREIELKRPTGTFLPSGPLTLPSVGNVALKAPPGLSSRSGPASQRGPPRRHFLDQKKVAKESAARGLFLVLLRSHRKSGPHFLCREKVTKSGRGAPRTPVQGDSLPRGGVGPSRPLFAAESGPPLAPG